MFEPLEEFQEKARQQWLSLNPRERTVLSVLAGVLCLLLSALVVKEAAGFFFRAESMAQNNLKNIERIQRLSDELLQQRSEMGRYDRLKGKRGEDFKITTYIETEAAKFGLSIAKMAPTKAQIDDKAPAQDWVEVALGKEATLDRVLKFLDSVEETLGVRIIELSIKTQFQDPTKLEVTTIIANLREL